MIPLARRRIFDCWGLQCDYSDAYVGQWYQTKLRIALTWPVHNQVHLALQDVVMGVAKQEIEQIKTIES